jgi:hypothetical protein
VVVFLAVFMPAFWIWTLFDTNPFKTQVQVQPTLLRRPTLQPQVIDYCQIDNKTELQALMKSRKMA